ncbi:hypothetical protein R3P38DRAFT_2518770, partial [Favolaschia claudopus]
KAARWALDTDVFIVPVDINELKKRPKNTKALKAEAAAKVQSMRESSADAMSGVFKDINGTTLACVFAAHGSDSRMIGVSPHWPYPGSQERAVEHYPRFLRTEENYDGLNVCGRKIKFDTSDNLSQQSLIQRTWEAAQMLHAVVQPVAPERDVRHVEDDKFMTYTPSGTAEVVSERAGVTHLVHCWPMQGHSKGPFMPSSDFFRGCQAAVAVRHYFQATQEVAIYLSCMFEVAFPEYYSKYSAAFKAGVWEIADPGPWIGRAIVYKLQVLEHVDGLDDGPTASFCVGDFAGGELYLSDIDVKLSYRQGDIIIFMSGLLYHTVGTWKSGSHISSNGITPGRVSHVFFFPQASFNELKDKPGSWMVATMAGANTCTTGSL